ncbi:hypothetical protein FE257_012755 [Aspergillus nanangensis]|uniref:FAD dependent oxidoreductase domain-containing protein n=1 Tax=Aspergillus nanangensis TaxID=2582783 RepID=A0AAD4CFJ4_ASPNN|nr:hypothetical protein FE257_012755 [Aspergillus nanangensis]
MPTVILGGGIIGASIAYYLSQNQPEEDIHIIESSPQLFSAASGYAAGFLAKDWFAPALAPLGEYSFNLHGSLAAQQNGAEKWGYMPGTALNLATEASKKTGTRGDDWLRDGTSRAETAASASQPVLADSPGWLTKQQGAEVEQISDPDTVAVVDPIKLSTFLLEEAKARGTKLHRPAKATALVTDRASNTLTAIKIMDLTTKTEFTLPCTNLIVAAGPWTPTVFHDLFPSSRVSVPMTPLAGYSLVLRSPRLTLANEQNTYKGRSHAVFTTHPPACGYSPEIFSRQGAEIYIAGLNPDLRLPACAEDTAKLFDAAEMGKLKEVAVRLLGQLAQGQTESTDDVPNVDDLEIVREGLCFRPVAARGIPVIARVEDSLLGGGVKTASKGGVFMAAGHGPWGISLSVGTGKVVADLVRGVQPGTDMKFVAIISAASLLGSSYAWKFTWHDADGTPTVESGKGPHACITINNAKGGEFEIDGEGEKNINMLLFTNPDCEGEPSGMASEYYKKDASSVLRGFKVVRLVGAGDSGTATKTGSEESATGTAAKPTHTAHETAKTASATASAEKTTSVAEKSTTAAAASTSAAATGAASATESAATSSAASGASPSETGAAISLSAGNTVKTVVGVVLGMAIWA